MYFIFIHLYTNVRSRLISVLHISLCVTRTYNCPYVRAGHAMALMRDDDYLKQPASAAVEAIQLYVYSLERSVSM